MTEAEWMACDTAVQMLKRFAPRPSSRKYRLFACACCREAWKTFPISPDALAFRAVGVAEKFADGLASEEELSWHCDELLKLLDGPNRPGVTDYAGAAFWATKSKTTVRDAKNTADHSCSYRPGGELIQTVIVKCVFGNPFRPVPFLPEWRTSTTVALARTIYESREFYHTMPILADALEEAGCDNEDVLNHCRGPRLHVRGCWVCDLVLGKE